MIDDLFALSQSFLRLRNRPFQRYFLKSHRHADTFHARSEKTESTAGNWR